MSRNLDQPRRTERLLEAFDHQIRWLFPLPAILVAGGLFVYPFFRLVWLSFTEYRLTSQAPPAFIGLANWAVSPPLLPAMVSW